jgi:hypothetical protein
MIRWVEEVELLEEEFCCLICGLEKMASIWESLSLFPSTELKHCPTMTLSSSTTLPGYLAYAACKAAMYHEMSVIVSRMLVADGLQRMSLFQSMFGSDSLH